MVTVTVQPSVGDKNQCTMILIICCEESAVVTRGSRKFCQRGSALTMSLFLVDERIQVQLCHYERAITHLNGVSLAER